MYFHAALREISTLDSRRLLQAARVIHPFPVALNIAATLALAAIAFEGLPPPLTLVQLGAAMFCAQAAIGASNDYFDRDLDAATKPYKPIVRGVIKPLTALRLAAAFALVAGVLAATLGLLSVAVGAIGLFAGLAYNARLKRSVFSPLPYMVALPALPFWVWVSLERAVADLWWLIPFAPFAALAVHLTNTAPDIEADRRAGVRGLAHTLGLRRSLLLAWGSFATALGLAVALGFYLGYDWQAFLLGAAPAAGLLVATVVAYAWQRSQAALQLGFGLIGIGTAALAGAWLAAVQ